MNVPEAEHSFTVDELCTVDRLSRVTLYKLWNEGRGPRFFRAGNRRRVSPEARREWHRELEAAETTGAA
jgi:hypothetical protein